MIVFVGTTGGCGCLLLFQFHDALLCLCECFLESIDSWIVVVLVVKGGRRWLGKGLQRLKQAVTARIDDFVIVGLLILFGTLE